MKIVIIEVTDKYQYTSQVGDLFAKLNLPNTIFVLVPKEAEVKIVDTVEV